MMEIDQVAALRTTLDFHSSSHKAILLPENPSLHPAI
jgi:hypothetical protein